MKTQKKFSIIMLILALLLVPQFSYAKTIEQASVPQSAIDQHYRNIEQILCVHDQETVDADILFERYCSEMEAFFEQYPAYKQQLQKKYNDTSTGVSPAASTTRAFWRIVADAMFALGMDSASFFMNHSLQDNPANIGLTTSGTVAGKIKQVAAYTSWLKASIGTFANSTTGLEQTKYSSMSFTKSQSSDLYYALKKVSTSVRMQRTSPQSPTVYFYSNVMDRYDFNEADYSVYEYFPDGTIVSLAYEAQSAGIIVPYNIVIQINGSFAKPTGILTYY